MLRIKTFIYKHKLLSIIVAAFFTILALMALASKTLLPGESPKVIAVTEQNGIYDLSHITGLEKTVVKLAPAATYYPNTYLLPSNENTSVPESVAQFEKINAEYLSQQFVLKLPDNSDSYAMTFRLSGRHAMRVYVNGKLVAQAGHPGTTKQDTELWDNNITFPRGCGKW